MPPDSARRRRNTRSRTGCLTCRRRHYKCDEVLPICLRCQCAQTDCAWPAEVEDFVSRSLAGSGGHLASPSHEFENKSIVPFLAPEVSTLVTDYLNLYLSRFHMYTYQMCAWTELMPLPKRSTIPTILQDPPRIGNRRLTNWANFYLLHLAAGNSDCPLSAAMAAYTALRLDQKLHAMSFYFKALNCLRSALCQKDPASIDNQDFLRIWSSVLLLNIYEQFVQNHHVAARHLDGAITLSFIAASRFPAEDQSSTITSHTAKLLYLHPDKASPVNIDSAAANDSMSLKCESNDASLALKVPSRPRNEIELPFFLTEATKLYRYINSAAQTLEIDWPRFWHREEPKPIAALLEKSAECFAHVLPLVQDYYVARGALNRTTANSARVQLFNLFATQYEAARRCIDEYNVMLRELKGPEYDSTLDFSDVQFAFNPKVHFINPQMLQPAVVPSVFLVLLAPFISDYEHYQALTYVSGVLAGRAKTEGLFVSSAYPDLFIAAFWRRGLERETFYQELCARKGDFMLCLNRIWATIDHLEACDAAPDKTDILGIALEEWRRTMMDGFKLQHIRTWQSAGWLLEPWATAVGAPDVMTSPFSSEEEKLRRCNWPDVRYYRARITQFRKRNGMPSSSLQHLVNSMQCQSPRIESLAPSLSDPRANEDYKGPYNLEDYRDQASHNLSTTLIGKVAQEEWRHDPDFNKIYFIL